VEQGFFHGPAFCDHDGKEIGSGIYEGLILEALLEHQDWEALQAGSQVPKLLEGIDMVRNQSVFQAGRHHPGARGRSGRS
jgi:hypothetical protein